MPAAPTGAPSTGTSATPSPNVPPKPEVINSDEEPILRARVKRLMTKIVEHVKAIEKCRKDDREKWQQFNKQIEELEALRAERMKFKKYKRKSKEKKSDETSGEKSKQSKKKSQKSGQGSRMDDVKKKQTSQKVTAETQQTASKDPNNGGK